MDINSAFALAVGQYCPKAEAVYDLYQVVARYGREVIDRSRVDQAMYEAMTNRRARSSSRAAVCCCATGRAWRKRHAVQLQELLRANQELAAAACVLKMS